LFRIWNFSMASGGEAGGTVFRIGVQAQKVAAKNESPKINAKRFMPRLYPFPNQTRWISGENPIRGPE
jgi:hypothetical protein